MGRTPCCEKSMGLKKGPWTPDEDEKLIEFIKLHGHGSWRALPKRAGLLRCGKSCRLRWTNYLRPDIKRGKFSIEEEHTIIELHAVLGNKWSTIAGHLPGRTDNEIKNYWNTHLKKRLLQMGIDPVTHRPRADLAGLPNGSFLFNGSSLSHVQQWENSRLAATAEYLKQAFFLSDKGFNPFTYLCMRPNQQYSQPWVHQQPGITLDFEGLPHNLEQLLHSQTTESATSSIKNLEELLVQCQNIGYCAPLSNSINIPSEYSNGSSVSAFASPCSTLTSMEGLHKKTHMLFHNQEDNILTKQAAVYLSERDMNINIMKAADHKPNVLFDQYNISYNNNNNGNQSCSVPTTTLWAACSLDPLQLVGSSNTTYNEAEIVPFSTTSSLVGNKNEIKSYGDEVGANEAGAKEYWNKVLKALGPIPASHIITA